MVVRSVQQWTMTEQRAALSALPFLEEPGMALQALPTLANARAELRLAPSVTLADVIVGEECQNPENIM